MKTIQNLKIGMMGVVNATPDSFSDGGKYNTSESFQAQLGHLKEVDILDIGAESTAPSNDPISSKEEIERLKVINYDQLNAFAKVSIDSYHPETVRYFLENFGGDLLWNDVSGVFDSQTKELLEEYPKLSYVFSHTHVPKKSETGHHMNYLQEDMDVAGKFHEFLVQANDLSNKIYLDPCFGFSKTREQNHQLIRELPDLVKQFEQDFIIGISRKSFLRFSELPKGDARLILETEALQSIILAQWVEQLKHLDRTIYFRMHDPVIYNSLVRFYSISNGTRKT